MGKNKDIWTECFIVGANEKCISHSRFPQYLLGMSEETKWKRQKNRKEKKEERSNRKWADT